MLGRLDQNIKKWLCWEHFRCSEFTYGVKKDQNVESLICLIFVVFFDVLTLWCSDFWRSDPLPDFGTWIFHSKIVFPPYLIRKLHISEAFSFVFL